MVMAQQGRNLDKQFLQPGKRDLADFTVFECNGIALMLVGADGIHAEQLTIHLKTDDLPVAIEVGAVGFEMSHTYCIQRSEAVADTIQMTVARYLAAADDLVEPLHIGFFQSHRQTQLMQAARRTTIVRHVCIRQR